MKVLNVKNIAAETEHTSESLQDFKECRNKTIENITVEVRFKDWATFQLILDQRIKWIRKRREYLKFHVFWNGKNQTNELTIISNLI